MKTLLVFSACLVGALCSRYTKYNLGHLVGYDAAEPPPGITNDRVGMYINSMALTDEGTMKIMFYMRQSWFDSRLAAIGENVRLAEERYKEIWRPDIFFRNAISAGRRNNGMTVEQLTRINSTGHVWHVMSIEGEFGCPPFQSGASQMVCPIMIESYGYTMDVLRFSWLDSPVDVDPQIQVKGVTLKDTILHDCSQNYTAGAFPCAEIRFLFSLDN